MKNLVVTEEIWKDGAGQYYVNLNIFWLKEDSLKDAADLPTPDVLVSEITENLESALAQFQNIQAELEGND